MTTTASQSKSGLKILKPGEVLFNDGEAADSLFIIQKGQVRLYKPKGKGYVELAVLRTGEVIGEMAFFDEDGSGKKRSCAAAAITPVEIIEISFGAFGKTMQSLNPWFKTIINTLVTRLRKANTRIRELEDNAAIAYGAKAGYEFMKPVEVMKILGTLFLVFKAHGEVQGQAIVVHKKTLEIYSSDMYHIMDAKLESVLGLLVQLGWMEIKEDDDKLPNVLCVKNLEIIRQIFVYYNGERHLPEDKKMRIGEKCEKVIAKMIELFPTNPLMDIPNQKVIDDVAPKFSKYYNVWPVLQALKEQQISTSPDIFDDGKNLGLFGEVMMKDDQVLVECDYNKVQRMYPIIRFMNAVKRDNAEKAPGQY